MQIGYLCEVKSSKRIYASEYRKKGIPFYRGKEIIEFSKGQNASAEIFIDETKYEQLVLKYGVPRRDDILMTAVGTLGVPYYVPNNNPFYFKDGNLIWFSCFKDNMNPKWFYYWLLSKQNSDFFNLYRIGSTQSALTIDQVKKIQILLPAIKVQQHIVDTIGSVDDLIEKIDSVCDKFTNYLQQVYGFYKERCDNYVELSQLVIKTSKTCKNHEWYGKNVVDLSTMKPEKIFVDSFSDGSSFKTNIKTLNNFDMVYGSVRPYFRKAGLVQDTNYACGTVFSFNVENKNNYLWVLATITSDDFHKYTKANSGGTKMPVIKWDTFCKYKVPYPNEQDLKQFNNRLGTIFQYCANLIREKTKLEKIKETLLHKYFD